MDPDTGRIYDTEALEREKLDAKVRSDEAAAAKVEELQRRLVELTDEEHALLKRMSRAERRRWAASRRLEARVGARGR